MTLSKGCKLSQSALDLVLAQGKDVVAIAGTKQVKYLEENAESTKIQLSQSDLDAIPIMALHEGLLLVFAIQRP